MTLGMVSLPMMTVKLEPEVAVQETVISSRPEEAETLTGASHHSSVRKISSTPM